MSLLITGDRNRRKHNLKCKRIIINWNFIEQFKFDAILSNWAISQFRELDWRRKSLRNVDKYHEIKLLL
jgi:hypothetical protein